MLFFFCICKYQCIPTYYLLLIRSDSFVLFYVPFVSLKYCYLKSTYKVDKILRIAYEDFSTHIILLSSDKNNFWIIKFSFYRTKVFTFISDFRVWCLINEKDRYSEHVTYVNFKIMASDKVLFLYNIFSTINYGIPTIIIVSQHYHCHDDDIFL